MPNRLERLIFTVNPKEILSIFRSRVAGGESPGLIPLLNNFSSVPPGAIVAMTSPITVPINAPNLRITNNMITLSLRLANRSSRFAPTSPESVTIFSRPSRTNFVAFCASATSWP